MKDSARWAQVNAGQLALFAPEVEVSPGGHVIRIKAIRSPGAVQIVSVMFCRNLVQAGASSEIRREKLKWTSTLRKAQMTKRKFSLNMID